MRTGFIQSCPRKTEGTFEGHKKSSDYFTSSMGNVLSLMNKVLEHICGARYDNIKIIAETGCQKGGKLGFYFSSNVVYLRLYVITEPYPTKCV